MKKPNITPGEWRVEPDGPCKLSVETDLSIICLMDFDRSDKEWSETHARAIAAIPALLAALESAYRTASQTVRDAYKCEYHQTTIAELEAERDLYKAALEAAGYEFSEPDPEDAEGHAEKSAAG